MPDVHYTDPRLALLYDNDCGRAADSQFYLSLSGPQPIRILDLGCGTGTLCTAYADLGHSVTGVDPARAMLDVARAKPNSGHITWVNTTAQAFRTARQFDLIVMTGHAFQVLVDDADIDATLAVMRDHLAPGGSIAFETRNPNIDWAHRWHGLTQDHVLDGHTVRQSFDVSSTSSDRITFTSHYSFKDCQLTSTSSLRFLTLAALTERINISTLRVRALFGDWDRGLFDPDNSDEMIFLLGH